MYIDLKNNTQSNGLIDYSKLQENTEVDNDILKDVATRLLKRYMEAFEELAE